MRVALDARTLQQHPPGGIGRSLANLLPRITPHVDVQLLTDTRYPPPVTDLPCTPLPTPVPGVSASWLQLSAARWLRRFDGVFHCPFYALPWSCPVPGVSTIHDITFEHYPHWFTRRQGVSFRLQARRAAATAACLITPSEFVKADLVETYGIDPERVLVAVQGVDPVFRPAADPGPVRERFGIRRPYVVSLGGADRRNLRLAQQTWSRAGRDVDLVVVGPERPQPAAGVHWAGAASDEDWAALLAGSEAFLYPTAYEGFGMPALEALAAGTPVIAARVGSLPEVLGDCAQWSESLEVTDLEAALSQLLSDDAARARLSQAGLARAAAWPGWDAAAEAHLRAYARAAAQ
jgi:glycosyltransferase involved in cell wall biosynthesis